jgi:hypothetical protein
MTPTFMLQIVMSVDNAELCIIIKLNCDTCRKNIDILANHIAKDMEKELLSYRSKHTIDSSFDKNSNEPAFEVKSLSPFVTVAMCGQASGHIDMAEYISDFACQFVQTYCEIDLILKCVNSYIEIPMTCNTSAQYHNV